MRTLDSFSDETWDRFIDWLYEEPEELTDAEVKERLREAGIDTRPVVERLRLLIEKHRQCPLIVPCHIISVANPRGAAGISRGIHGP